MTWYVMSGIYNMSCLWNYTTMTMIHYWFGKAGSSLNIRIF